MPSIRLLSSHLRLESEAHREENWGKRDGYKVGEIKKPSYCLPDTLSVMDKNIHLAQEWEKLEGRRTQGQQV